MSIISAAVPTATPPASVAFWMCTWVGRAGRPELSPLPGPAKLAVCGGCRRWEAGLTPRASREPADRRGPHPGPLLCSLHIGRPHQRAGHCPWTQIGVLVSGWVSPLGTSARSL